MPNYDHCQYISDIDDRIACLENGMRDDIGSDRFIPYIQKFEFEALLFSNNRGFENYYEGKIVRQTAAIVDSYPNPEEINDNPATSPSNRLKNIIPQYNKVSVGNIIALDVGTDAILEKCPRFRNWVEILIEAVK
jgi:hypothetical protein